MVTPNLTLLKDAFDISACPVRCGVYCRISADDDYATIKQLGVKRQEKSCRSLIDAQSVNGWQVVDVYVDNNLSASKDDVYRPEFHRLLQDLESGRINRIVVLSQERLVRLPEETEMVIKLHKKLKLREIATVMDGVLNIGSLQGRAMVRVKGAFDIYYTEFISEKVTLKKQELAERGLPAGGTRPFGFSCAGRKPCSIKGCAHDGGMSLVLNEANILREAAARLLAGETMWQIIYDLDHRGIKPPTTDHWTGTSLRRMLLSPRVTKLREHRGTIIGDAAWPQILDRDTWDRLHAILITHRDRAPRGGRRTRLLTGFLKCPKCGMNLQHGVNNNEPAYQCVKTPGHEGCQGTSIKAKPTEEEILGRLFAVYSSPKLAKALTAPTDSPQGRIDSIRQRIRVINESYTKGNMEESQFNESQERLNADLQDAEREKALVKVVENDLSIVEPYVGNGRLEQDWSTFDVMRQRLFIQFAIEKIDVLPVLVRGKRFDPDRLDVDWKRGFADVAAQQ